jgi:hypothetical protein
MTFQSRIFIRVVFVFGAVVLITLVWASGSILISLKEHLLHGSHTQVQQISVDLPLLWRVDSGPHQAKGLHLGRARFGTYETEHLVIGFDVDRKDFSADEWQRVTLLKHAESPGGAHYKGEVVPTKHYIFYCVKRDETELSPVDLTCETTTSDLKFVYYGGQEHLGEARSILSSLQ